MAATKNKALELQAQVRHNAEEFKNTISDLYSWQKEMKEKEEDLQRQPQPDEQDMATLKTLPVRSHETETTNSNNKQQHQEQAQKRKADRDPGPIKKRDEENHPEKCDEPNVETLQRANEIKDRGNQMVKLGEYEKAIYQYTDAIQLRPNDPIFYSNRSLCYLKLERYNECIEDCDRAIDIDKLSVKAYYRRMQANESLGNNMDALKDCTTVLTIEPNNSEAKRSLERINNRIRKHVKLNAANFTPLRDNMLDILPNSSKPAYKRSTKPLYRVPIHEVVLPQDTHTNLKISDEDLDKLFNSNCGPFVEIKGATVKKPVAAATRPDEVVDAKKDDVARKTTPTIEEKTPLKSLPIEPLTDSNKTVLNNPSASAAQQAQINELPPVPISTHQFYANWNELSQSQKYQYLKCIETQNLSKILGAGFDSDTLTDIIRIMHDYYIPNKDPTLSATILEVSKNAQVGILSLLMSLDERKLLSEIVNSIKGAGDAIANIIAKNFNIHYM